MVATPFWNSGEIRGIARDGAADQVERHNRIVAQSRATRHGTARHQEKPDRPGPVFLRPRKLGLLA